MKIAHVSATFPPYQAGTGRVCYFNALELARLGHDVTVFTAAHPKGEYAYPPEIKVKRLPIWLRFGNAPLLPDLLREIHDFDIIHQHFPFIFGAELTWFAAQRHHMPYVITHHNDLIAGGVRGFLFNLYFPVTKQLVVQNASRFIAVQYDHAANCLLTSIFEKRWQDVIEVPNGVDTDIFYPGIDSSELREKYNLVPDTSVILFVGALDTAHLFKGVRFLLEAFAQIGSANAILMIVGEGDMRESYQEEARRLGINDRTIFTGNIHHECLGAYYSLADVVVLPSTSVESFGMVLIEGMACAKPVVATNLPGVRSVVDDGQDGFLVEPGNTDQLAERVQFMLDNPEFRKQMGEKGRKKVEVKYTWRRVAQRLELVYQQVLDGTLKAYGVNPSDVQAR